MADEFGRETYIGLLFHRTNYDEIEREDGTFLGIESRIPFRNIPDGQRISIKGKQAGSAFIVTAIDTDPEYGDW